MGGGTAMASPSFCSRDLLLGGSQSLGAGSPSDIARRMPSTVNLSSSMLSAKTIKPSPMAGKVRLRADAKADALTMLLAHSAPFEEAGHAREHREMSDEPEPYLLQVWEHLKKRSVVLQKPPRRELQVLGALAPLAGAQASLDRFLS